MPMADSCWGLTENNKIPQSNHPSVKKYMNYKKINKISECENVKKEKLGYRANWVENYFMLFVRKNAFMSWHLINTPRTSLMK